MSVSCKTTVPEMQGPVAFKVVSSDLDQQLGRERLVGEIRALPALVHPTSITEV